MSGQRVERGGSAFAHGIPEFVQLRERERGRASGPEPVRPPPYAAGGHTRPGEPWPWSSNAAVFVQLVVDYNRFQGSVGSTEDDHRVGPVPTNLQSS